MNYFNRLTSVSEKQPKRYKIASARVVKEKYDKLQMLLKASNTNFNDFVNGHIDATLKNNSEIIGNLQDKFVELANTVAGKAPKP